MTTFTSVTVPTFFSASAGKIVSADTVHPFHAVNAARKVGGELAEQMKAFMNWGIKTRSLQIAPADLPALRKMLKSL